jgi:hypothetical protein
MTDLICQNERRREAVRRKAGLYGLDYLNVGDDQRTLTARFLGKAPQGLSKENVLIEGGQRIRGIRVISAETEFFDDPEMDDALNVVVDRAGDFSTYTLRIVERDEQGQRRPHHELDSRYDSVEFNFKVDCPSGLDCKIEQQCPPVKRDEPEINYLAKDYASFRQLIFDRLALVMPDWKERHVPDIGAALVELLAYTGDYLSYYQDAVATEAYPDTARQRISVRRHARLVDYQMSEGCNARAWVTIKTDGDPQFDPRDIYFITGFDDTRGLGVTLAEDELQKLPGGYEIFEPMTGGTIRLYEAHGEMRFYTWGDDECCLDRGGAAATLIGELVSDDQPPDQPPEKCDPPQYDSEEQPQQPAQQATQQTGQDNTPKLHLRPGDVLIFEEVIGPKTGNEADADPARRHAVRLTRVEAATDPLNDQPIVEIEWAAEDALPFPLCISALGPPPDCEIIRDVSVARGNVILVDHGRTIEEDLEKVRAKAIVERCETVEGEIAEIAIRHSTLVPGWTLGDNCEPGRPAEPSLELFCPRARVSIEHSIIGSIQVHPLASVVEGAGEGKASVKSAAAEAGCDGVGHGFRIDPICLSVNDSVLDATGLELEAIGAPGCVVAHARLTILRSTVFGQIQVHAIDLGENTIFDGRVFVARRQRGYLRFCYVAPESRTPRRYHCQPDLAVGDLQGEEKALAERRVRPRFISVRYGRPDYCRLAGDCPEEITRGADDESEMGVFHDLYQPQRLANLRARLDEYTPAGMDAGIIFINY